MRIPYVDLKKQYNFEKKKLLKIIDNVLSQGTYVGGNEILKLETQLAKICNSKYAVTFNSGTDALTMALILCGVKKGDEVITPPNSFVASTATIVHIGAKPVFVDVGDDQNIDPDLLEKKITKKTKAIMPVHLTGRVCKMDKILRIASKFNLKVIEDSAQSIGSKFKNKSAGSFGDIGCFSTHPLKNLNAMGDGGFFVTNNKSYYLKALSLRSHGIYKRNIIKNFGYVSRMDNLQAAILNFRLNNLDNVIQKRRNNASIYLKHLDKKNYFFPKEKYEEFNTYHTFVIQVKNRKKLIKFLEQKKISTAIHYPIPIHLQPAAKKLGYKRGDFPVTEKQSSEIITLPVNQFLSSKEIIYISNAINSFYDK
ncbi:DegT/DnrJ/EryC1/StrS family aminotransferase [Candidatus Pelagibacter sp.]|nr:DegT/DnrJ/EryC1/StrS family aminotransferase [Candidatus Pelagibacter sp.]